MQFDTGSSGVYLVTDACVNTGCDSKNFQKYISKDSNYFRLDDTSSKSNDQRTEIVYGKGSISG